MMTDDMRRIMMFLSLILTGCNAPVRPCSSGQVRGWCLIDISTTTFEDLSNNCDPIKTQTAVTMCLPASPKGSMGAAMALIFRVTDWLRANYWSGPGGMNQYVIKGDTIISADFHRDPGGYTACNTVAGDTNPYNTSGYVNLDASAVEHPKIQPQTAGGGGGASDDCATCLAGACPMTMGPDLEMCIHDHCGALCPRSTPGSCSGSTPPPAACGAAGDACGLALCCAGLVCYASDVGSVCM